jgi:hypothetical protein
LRKRVFEDILTPNKKEVTWKQKLKLVTAATVVLTSLPFGQVLVVAEEPIAQDSANIKLTITGTLSEPVIEALDDYATTEQNQPVLIDVLANDQAKYAELDRDTLEIIAQPKHGQAIVANQQANYSPNRDFFGNDEFTYRICNTQAMCDEAKVFVEVRQTSQPEPQPPEPEPQEPLVPLPITGGSALITASALSAATTAGLFLFIFRRRQRQFQPTSDNKRKKSKR